MQNNEQSLLLIHRENYKVPMGQERSVHCKIAKFAASGEIIEKARIAKYGIKEFDTYVKRNLELMGYKVEILYHPKGTYTNDVINDKDALLNAKEREILELKAKLEAIEAKDKEVETKEVETKVEEPAPKEVKVAAKAPNKGGRPKKGGK